MSNKKKTDYCITIDVDKLSSFILKVAVLSIIVVILFIGIIAIVDYYI